jgi:hypothetical protein
MSNFRANLQKQKHIGIIVSEKFQRIPDPKPIYRICGAGSSIFSCFMPAQS